MMQWSFGFLFVVTVFVSSAFAAPSTPDSLTYTAAVVEYAVQPADTLAKRTTDYVNYIKDPLAADADIIVFPEMTLTDRVQATFVPDAATKAVPCDLTEYADSPIQPLSCAARDAAKYVVVNLVMKRNCTEELLADPEDDRTCGESELNLYNTNVVFDRSGAIISIYRKFNLFGEPGINHTRTADISWFDTDFGVRFGHFICFDLAFDLPALELVRQGVKNFAFPTMWFAEIPFLSGVQAQQSWAYANNVNFLGAGANNPVTGTTGSGIYAGRQGALKSVMSGVKGNFLLVNEIAKDPGTNPSVAHQQFATVTPDIVLKRDHLDVYATQTVDDTITEEQNFQVCHKENESDVTEFCCQFNVQLESAAVVAGEIAYTYVAGSFAGNRTYDNVGSGIVLTCGIMACTDKTDLKTCGTIFPNGQAASVVNRHRFTKLEIAGTFPIDDALVLSIMPSTLGISLMPLDSDYFGYSVTDEFVVGEMKFRNVSMNLLNANQHLLTFGIYAREFPISSASISIGGSLLVTVVVALLAKFL